MDRCIPHAFCFSPKYQHGGIIKTLLYIHGTCCTSVISVSLNILCDRFTPNDEFVFDVWIPKTFLPKGIIFKEIDISQATLHSVWHRYTTASEDGNYVIDNI